MNTKTYNLATIGGDGTGPEVVREAIKALRAIETRFPISFSLTDLPYNGDRYLKTGITLTDEELNGLKAYDAILLGAIGHPDIKPGIVEKGILLKIRFGLDQYINLRPVKLYPNVDTPLKNKTSKEIDYVVIRENSGGLYTGSGGTTMKDTPHEVAVQNMIYTHMQVERCLKYAFEFIQNRHKDTPWKGLSDEEKQQGYIGKLTLCGKSNVLTYVFDLWERVFKEIGKNYPQIKCDYVHVDAMCIYMIDCPEKFNVIVTENLFGDIITDLAAITQGGLGVSPGGNINPNGVSMFEPIGGTAPQFTGLNQINPLAAIGSAQLLLAHLGEAEAADCVEAAIAKTILNMKSMAAGQMGHTTEQIGEMVANYIVS
jgi:3-isopropylmalate dehydrogenase